jgi:hypothetical protein
MMTIRYNITRLDLLRFQLRSILNNKFLIGFWILAIGWNCYAEWHRGGMIEHDLAYKITYCVVSFVFYFLIMLGITLLVVGPMIYFRKNLGLLGEHRLSLTDEGLIESTIHDESLSRWSAYHKTVSTRSYLLLYVKEGRAHIISRKRPLLEGNLAEFEEALRQKTRKT